jgi:hypothetical protein
MAVRRSVNSLNAAELTRLKQAVATLRQRSTQNPQNPIGWVAQANIHRDRCAHSNWWFLPWHRAYLYYFERLLQSAVGDASMFLPYWDWTAQPSLPASFWGANNPLHDPTRVIAPTSTASSGSVGQTVIDRIVRTTDFRTFGGGQTSGPRVRGASGMLENTPHNYIHNFVGGSTGNMSDPAVAARDPIFWLHHANIDRLWARWSSLHPGRNPTQNAWLNQAFTFTNTSGAAASMTAAQTLNMQNLAYSYA